MEFTAKYIVWIDLDWDGWCPQEFDTLKEANEFIEGETCLTVLTSPVKTPKKGKKCQEA